MYAKYIKREIPDLNGTGRTQAYYQMELKPMSFESFVSQCAREGNMEESQILAVMSLVSEKLALCMAEGFSVKLDGGRVEHAFTGPVVAEALASRLREDLAKLVK